MAEPDFAGFRFVADPMMPDGMAVMEGSHALTCKAALSRSLLVPCTCGGRVVIRGLAPSPSTP